MTTNLGEATAAALDREFDAGANAVRLRFPTGYGKNAHLAAFVAAKAKEGPILVIVPLAVKQQFRDELTRAAPNVSVGDWGSGETVEVTSPLHAGSNAEQRSTDAFPWIVVDEAHSANAHSIKRVTDHFTTSRVLEALAMPHPHPGNVQVDADIDVAALGPSPHPVAG